MPAQDNELAATTSQLNLALDKEDLFCCYKRSHNLLKIIKMIEASRLEGLTLLMRDIYTNSSLDPLPKFRSSDRNIQIKRYVPMGHHKNYSNQDGKRVV